MYEKEKNKSDVHIFLYVKQKFIFVIRMKGERASESLFRILFGLISTQLLVINFVREKKNANSGKNAGH